MECPICGHKLGENDAFCSNCGNFSLPMQDESRSVPVVETPPGTPMDGSALVSPPDNLEDARPPRKVAERLYPPPEVAEALDNAVLGSPYMTELPEDTSSTPPVRQVIPPHSRAKAQKRSLRRWKIFAIVACCVAAVCLAVSAYIVYNTMGMRVQLNRAQRESTTAQANAASLEAQVNTLSQDLEETKSENQTLGAQVADLQSQINQLESRVNQSEYDKQAAQTQLQDVSAQLTTVSGEKEALESELSTAQEDLRKAQEENETLQDENDSLSKQVSDYSAEVEFFDTYVVFVMTGSSDRLYHKYSCPNFTKKNFLAYSTRLAEANGYSPCPICFGSGNTDNTNRNE